MNSSDRENARGGNGSSGGSSGLVNSVEQMVRLPLEMTGATWDLMMQGMRNMTGTGRGSSGTDSVEASGDRSMAGEDATATSTASPSTSRTMNPQDLGADDLKYVVWTLVFTKPGLECVLEPQHSDLVNYSADVSSFAAVKIAKFLEKARHGRVEKPESWHEYNYPPEHPKASERRTEAITAASSDPGSGGMASGGMGSNDPASGTHERGWRIPADDHKFITFLHRVDWRLPKQEEVTRVERVTIERGTATTRIA